MLHRRLILILTLIFVLSNLSLRFMPSRADPSPFIYPQIDKFQKDSAPADGAGNAPLVFVENVGQFAEAIQYRASFPSGSISVVDRSILITLSEMPSLDVESGTLIPTDDKNTGQESFINQMSIELSFPGAARDILVQGLDEIDTRYSYLRGEPSETYTNVPTWSQIHFEGLYPGVDLILDGSAGEWRWWISLQPHIRTMEQAVSALNQFQIDVVGAEGILYSNSGFMIETSAGVLGLPRFEVYWHDGSPMDHSSVEPLVSNPFSFQVLPLPKSNKIWTLSFVHRGSSKTSSADIIFTRSQLFEEINASNRSILAPRLSWGDPSDRFRTIRGTDVDVGMFVAVDLSGDVYVMGSSYSDDFPSTPGAFQEDFGGGTNGDAFVAKLHGGTGNPIYVTYLGGSDNDFGYDGAVDESGHAFIVGSTYSDDFPKTTGAFQEDLVPGDCGTKHCPDVFITKLNASGSALVYSTYFGGSGKDGARAIQVGDDGIAYVAGYTSSSDLPVTILGVPSAVRDDDKQDAFVAVFNPTGSNRTFGTYIGGTQPDWAYGVDADEAGTVYVTGSTQSSDLKALYQTPLNSLAGMSDAFVVKIQPGGPTLEFIRFIGGTDVDAAYGIVVSPTEDIYIAGQTNSPSFPAQDGDFQEDYFDGGGDIFVSQLSSSGDQLKHATFLGGSGAEYSGVGKVIALNSNNQVFVTGTTSSADFPRTVDATQIEFQDGYANAFLSVLSADLSKLVYSTYVNGAFDNYGNSVATSGDDTAYVAGYISYDGWLDNDVYVAKDSFDLDFTKLIDAQGFDTCAAPTLEEMQAWWGIDRPYKFVGIYIGGVALGCEQHGLNAEWVSQVAAVGWRFLPIWGGPQAPCREESWFNFSDDKTEARIQGAQEARDALAAAQSLGFSDATEGTILYYDLEPFDELNSVCKDAVDALVSGWTDELLSHGSKAGVYGLSSNVAGWWDDPDIATAPDVAWIAYWGNNKAYDENASLEDIPNVPNEHWAVEDHRRIRQYAKGHEEERGGFPIKIDSNVASGIVAAPVNARVIRGSAPDHVDILGSDTFLGDASGLIVEEMALITPTAGWALVNGSLRWTETGGQRWEEITPPDVTDHTIMGVFFIDASQGWVVSAQPSDVDDSVDTFFSKTSTSGMTWETSPLQSFSSGDFPDDAHIQFIDPLTGWVVIKLASSSNASVGVLLRTTDGGETWDELQIPNGNPIRFSSASKGWTLGGPGRDQLFITEDGGDTWNPQVVVPPGEVSAYIIYHLPTFESTLDGLLPVILNDLSETVVRFYITTNGGDTWNLSQSIPLTNELRPSSVFPISIVDTSHWILPTSDSLPGLSERAVGLDFITPDLGWVYTGSSICSQVGDTIECAPDGSLLQTTDGGLTFEELPVSQEHLYLPIVIR